MIAWAPVAKDLQVPRKNFIVESCVYDCASKHVSRRACLRYAI